MSNDEITIKMVFNSPEKLTNGFDSKYELYVIFWDEEYALEKFGKEIISGTTIKTKIVG